MKTSQEIFISGGGNLLKIQFGEQIGSTGAVSIAQGGSAYFVSVGDPAVRRNSGDTGSVHIQNSIVHGTIITGAYNTVNMNGNLVAQTGKAEERASLTVPFDADVMITGDFTTIMIDAELGSKASITWVPAKGTLIFTCPGLKDFSIEEGPNTEPTAIAALCGQKIAKYTGYGGKRVTIIE